MPRKTSRRSGMHSRENTEQEFRQEGDSEEQKRQGKSLEYSDDRAGDTNTLIADMAQGFIQAQAKMSNNNTNYNNKEITALLKKVNDQLEDLKCSTQGQKNSGQTGQSQKKNATEDSGEESNEGQSQDLETLLRSILQSKNSDENSSQQSSNSKNKAANKANGEEKQQQVINVQTVSQILAQAQYDLANELEDSLKKLKQVIKESEKLATNIGNLLGEEKRKKS